MMQFFNKSLYSIALVIGLAVWLIACEEKGQTPLSAMVNECPMDYKLSDVKEVTNHYREQAALKNDYIAFKHYLRDGGYQLVSLVKGNEVYELSTSIIPISGSLLTITIDPETALSIFSHVDEIDAFVYPESPGNMTHSECAIATVKYQSTQTVGYFYNPDKNDKESQNKARRLYALLSSLVDEHFPNYQINVFKKDVDRLKTVTVNNQSFYEDNYIPPTESEAKLFLGLLKDDPFFELNAR